MDKIAYIRLVRMHVDRRIASLRLGYDEVNEVRYGIKRLIEQYLSCSEMEGAPRWKFDPALLERAYGACISDDDSQARSLVGSSYPRALEIAPDILKEVFEVPRRQR